MIYESAPWRTSLSKDAAILEWQLRKRPTEKRAIIIEQKVFIAAFTMRRLMQSYKLSSDMPSRLIACRTFPSIKDMDLRGRWDVSNHYDLTRGQTTTKSIKYVLDRIIHSYTFIEIDFGDGLNAIAFNSDRHRNDELWTIYLTDYVALMRMIATDDPPTFIMRQNPQSGMTEIWSGEGDPPNWPISK